MLAAEKGHTEIVKLLLEKNADVNATSSNGGLTALMYAAQKGHIEIVKLLLNKGADTNVATPDGDTALMLANDVEIVKLLINKGTHSKGVMFRVLGGYLKDVDGKGKRMLIPDGVSLLIAEHDKTLLLKSGMTKATVKTLSSKAKFTVVKKSVNELEIASIVLGFNNDKLQEVRP